MTVNWRDCVFTYKLTYLANEMHVYVCIRVICVLVFLSFFLSFFLSLFIVCSLNRPGPILSIESVRTMGILEMGNSMPSLKAQVMQDGFRHLSGTPLIKSELSPIAAYHIHSILSPFSFFYMRRYSRNCILMLNDRPQESQRISGGDSGFEWRC